MIKVTDRATHLHTHCPSLSPSPSSSPSPAQLQPGQTLCLFCWHAEPSRVGRRDPLSERRLCVCLQIQIPHRQVSYMHPATASALASFYPCLAVQQCLVNWWQLSEKCLRQRALQRATHIPPAVVQPGWPPSLRRGIRHSGVKCTDD